MSVLATNRSKSLVDRGIPVTGVNAYAPPTRNRTPPASRVRITRW
jgi:hypothetical protein